MAENLTPKKYIDSNNMKQILTTVKNEIHSDDSIITTEAEYLALPEEEKLNNSYYLYDIGVHYKNGVAYSRKKPIQLTMEEYKALGKVDPDQEYIVSADEQGILLGAEDIGYSNAVSNLPCTTVQGAIDTVNANLGELKKVIQYENAIQLVNTDYIRTDDIGFTPKLSRTGNIVTLSMRLWCKEVDMPTDIQVKVLDIPNGYKPIDSIYSTAPTNNINKTLVISYTLINENGVLIRPFNENLNGLQLYFPIMTWITNDELPN